MPPVAAVISFVDGINRGDVDHLATLMAKDHRLQVFDESPLEGRAANIEAWLGYTSSFPDYVSIRTGSLHESPKWWSSGIQPDRTSISLTRRKAG